jgi:SOS-response transcriptional repressor LexA
MSPRWDGHYGGKVPNDAIGNGATRVLLAVMADEHPTIRRVCAATGLASTSTVLAHLRALRRAGLVSWADGKDGTLRATCYVVPTIGSAPVAGEWWG